MKSSLNNKYFKLYTSCVPVKGYFRSNICDLQRNNYELIPNSLFDILTLNKNETIESILEKHDSKDKEVILEYFEYLIDKEFGFWTKYPSLFPEMSLEWSESSTITNAIIDSNIQSNHDYKSIFNQLEELGCKHIQLRFFDVFSLDLLEVSLKLLTKSSILSVELILKFDPLLTVEDYERLVRSHPRLERVVVHSSSFSKSYNDFDKNKHLFILNFIEKKIDSDVHCGIIHSGYFTNNLENFLESQNNNSCLNKKISVDSQGRIKNCPSQKNNFGHISNTTLKESILREKFQDNWKISMDMILNCKDCENRYMCTDCRVFIEDDSNIYSKPSKCNYNPYIAKWKNEEGYIPIDDCGIFTDDNIFIVDKEMVAQMNKDLWG